MADWMIACRCRACLSIRVNWATGKSNTALGSMSNAISAVATPAILRARRSSAEYQASPTIIPVCRVTVRRIMFPFAAATATRIHRNVCRNALASRWLISSSDHVAIITRVEMQNAPATRSASRIGRSACRLRTSHVANISAVSNNIIEMLLFNSRRSNFQNWAAPWTFLNFYYLVIFCQLTQHPTVVSQINRSAARRVKHMHQCAIWWKRNQHSRMQEGVSIVVEKILFAALTALVTRANVKRGAVSVDLLHSNYVVIYKCLYL